MQGLRRLRFKFVQLLGWKHLSSNFNIQDWSLAVWSALRAARLDPVAAFRNE
jgi:hypothetical protein